jgi:hypothetical protein
MGGTCSAHREIRVLKPYNGYIEEKRLVLLMKDIKRVNYPGVGASGGLLHDNETSNSVKDI